MRKNPIIPSLPLCIGEDRHFGLFQIYTRMLSKIYFGTPDFIGCPELFIRKLFEVVGVYNEKKINEVYDTYIAPYQIEVQVVQESLGNTDEFVKNWLVSAPQDTFLLCYNGNTKKWEVYFSNFTVIKVNELSQNNNQYFDEDLNSFLSTKDYLYLESNKYAVGNYIISIIIAKKNVTNATPKALFLSKWHPIKAIETFQEKITYDDFNEYFRLHLDFRKIDEIINQFDEDIASGKDITEITNRWDLPIESSAQYKLEEYYQQLCVSLPLIADISWNSLVYKSKSTTEGLLAWDIGYLNRVLLVKSKFELLSHFVMMRLYAGSRALYDSYRAKILNYEKNLDAIIMSTFPLVVQDILQLRYSASAIFAGKQTINFILRNQTQAYVYHIKKNNLQLVSLESILPGISGKYDKNKFSIVSVTDLGTNKIALLRANTTNQDQAQYTIITVGDQRQGKLQIVSNQQFNSLPCLDVYLKESYHELGDIAGLVTVDAGQECMLFTENGKIIRTQKKETYYSESIVKLFPKINQSQNLQHVALIDKNSIFLMYEAGIVYRCNLETGDVYENNFYHIIKNLIEKLKVKYFNLLIDHHLQNVDLIEKINVRTYPVPYADDKNLYYIETNEADNSADFYLIVEGGPAVHLHKSLDLNFLKPGKFIISTYQDKPYLVKATNLSPNHSHVQCWRLPIINEPRLRHVNKENYNEIITDIYNFSSYDGLAVIVKMTSKAHVYSLNNKLQLKKNDSLNRIISLTNNFASVHVARLDNEIIILDCHGSQQSEPPSLSSTILYRSDGTLIGKLASNEHQKIIPVNLNAHLHLINFDHKNNSLEIWRLAGNDERYSINKIVDSFGLNCNSPHFYDTKRVYTFSLNNKSYLAVGYNSYEQIGYEIYLLPSFGGKLDLVATASPFTKFRIKSPASPKLIDIIPTTNYQDLRATVDCCAGSISIDLIPSEFDDFVPARTDVKLTICGANQLSIPSLLPQLNEYTYDWIDSCTFNDKYYVFGYVPESALLRVWIYDGSEIKLYEKTKFSTKYDEAYICPTENDFLLIFAEKKSIYDVYQVDGVNSKEFVAQIACNSFNNSVDSGYPISGFIYRAEENNWILFRYAYDSTHKSATFNFYELDKSNPGKFKQKNLQMEMSVAEGPNEYSYQPDMYYFQTILPLFIDENVIAVGYDIEYNAICIFQLPPKISNSIQLKFQIIRDHEIKNIPNKPDESYKYSNKKIPLIKSYVADKNLAYIFVYYYNIEPSPTSWLELYRIDRIQPDKFILNQNSALSISLAESAQTSINDLIICKSIYGYKDDAKLILLLKESNSQTADLFSLKYGSVLNASAFEEANKSATNIVITQEKYSSLGDISITLSFPKCRMAPTRAGGDLLASFDVISTSSNTVGFNNPDAQNGASSVDHSPVTIYDINASIAKSVDDAFSAAGTNNGNNNIKPDEGYKVRLANNIKACLNIAFSDQNYQLIDALIAHDIEKLNVAGYTSAYDIARSSVDDLKKLNLASISADQLYAGTVYRYKRLTLKYLSQVELASPHVRTTLDKHLVKHFTIDRNYSNLFGSQNYFNVDLSNTIYSPAAYFYDLMRLVDDNNSTQIYSLSMRRPDLRLVPLDSIHTTTEIKFLTILFFVLAVYLDKNCLSEKSLPKTATFDDKVAFAINYIFDDRHLASSTQYTTLFRAPFVLPYEVILGELDKKGMGLCSMVLDIIAKELPDQLSDNSPTNGFDPFLMAENYLNIADAEMEWLNSLIAGSNQNTIMLSTYNAAQNEADFEELYSVLGIDSATLMSFINITRNVPTFANSSDNNEFALDFKVDIASMTQTVVNLSINKLNKLSAVAYLARKTGLSFNDIDRLLALSRIDGYDDNKFEYFTKLIWLNDKFTMPVSDIEYIIVSPRPDDIKRLVDAKLKIDPDFMKNLGTDLINSSMGVDGLRRRNSNKATPITNSIILLCAMLNIGIMDLGILIAEARIEKSLDSASKDPLKIVINFLRLGLLIRHSGLSSMNFCIYFHAKNGDDVSVFQILNNVNLLFDLLSDIKSYNIKSRDVSAVYFYAKNKALPYPSYLTQSDQILALAANIESAYTQYAQSHIPTLTMPLVGSESSTGTAPPTLSNSNNDDSSLKITANLGDELTRSSQKQEFQQVLYKLIATNLSIQPNVVNDIIQLLLAKSNAAGPVFWLEINNGAENGGNLTPQDPLQQLDAKIITQANDKSADYFAVLSIYDNKDTDNSSANPLSSTVNLPSKWVFVQKNSNAFTVTQVTSDESLNSLANILQNIKKLDPSGDSSGSLYELTKIKSNKINQLSQRACDILKAYRSYCLSDIFSTAKDLENYILNFVSAFYRLLSLSCFLGVKIANASNSINELFALSLNLLLRGDSANNDSITLLEILTQLNNSNNTPNLIDLMKNLTSKYVLKNILFMKEWLERDEKSATQALSLINNPLQNYNSSNSTDNGNSDLQDIITSNIAKAVGLQMLEMRSIYTYLLPSFHGNEFKDTEITSGTYSKLNIINWLRIAQHFLNYKKLLGLEVDSLLKMLDLLKQSELGNHFAISQNLANTLLSNKSNSSSCLWLQATDNVLDRQRDALVGVVYEKVNSSTEGEIDTLDKLSEFFLLDVKMSAVYKTSYMSQAHASLQMYLQRCRMGIEKDDQGLPINLNIPENWWPWITQYRIWEANRKIFINPENYIEPDLRLSKSPQFDELMQALSASPLDDRIINDAMLNYFESMAILSDLVIVDAVTSSPSQDDPFFKQVVYIFAHTKQTPYKYYYREVTLNLVKNPRGTDYAISDICWNYWQSIEQTIKASIVTATIFHNQLFLFWVEAKLKKSEMQFAPEKSLAEGKAPVSTELVYQIKYLRRKANKEWDAEQIIQDGVFTGEYSYAADEKKGYFDYSSATLQNSFLNLPVTNDTSVGSQQTPNPPENSLMSNQVVIVNQNDKLLLIYCPFEYAYIDHHQDHSFICLIDSTLTPTIVTGSIYSQVGWNAATNQQKLYLRSIMHNSTDNKTNMKVDYSLGQPSQDGLLNTINQNSDLIRVRSVDNPTGISQYAILNNLDEVYFISLSYKKQFYRLASRAAMIELKQQLGVEQIGNLFGALGKDIEHDFNHLGPSLDANKDEYPKSREIDFNGGMRDYYMELFYFIPLLCGKLLNSQQQYESAHKWYQYIYDPIKHSDSDFKLPCFSNIDTSVSSNQLTDSYFLNIYHTHAFDPNAIAQLRPVIYMKLAVIKFVKNLIDWADYQFTLDTRETITTATNLYYMANDILGKKPIALGVTPLPVSSCFQDFVEGKEVLDAEVLNAIYYLEEIDHETTASNPDLGHKLLEFDPYFSIPENSEFIQIWDTVADRLFKIRHSLNMEGEHQDLDLFSPEIDPHQLIASMAMSGGLLNVTSLQKIVPLYRFDVLLEHAMRLAAELNEFEQTLLSLAEREDAEAFAQLHNEQEAAMLQLTTELHDQEITVADKQLELLEGNIASVDIRISYYKGLVEEVVSAKERNARNLTLAAGVLNTYAIGPSSASGIAFALPQDGSPFAMTYGGQQLGAALAAEAGALQYIASGLNLAATILEKDASNDRRLEEWQFQLDNANKDKENLAVQKDIAKLQRNIAQKQQDMNDQQIKFNQQTTAYYRSKFSNIQLYRWMQQQLGGLQSQLYQLALKTALSAQNAYQIELNTNKSIISNNPFSFYNKGLTMGKKLQFQLEQLKTAYLDGNSKLLCIDKTISLKDLITKHNASSSDNTNSESAGGNNNNAAPAAPAAIFSAETLKRGISFDLRATDFSEDFASHIFRRIKMISVTVPSISKPYQNIYLELEMTRNTIETGSNQTELGPIAGVNKIIISTGNNDMGFFHFEGSPRYYPFEGKGVISSWTIKYPDGANRNSDDVTDLLNSISDIIINLKYTAQQDTAVNFNDDNAPAPGRH